MTSTNLDDPVDIAAREDGVWDAYRLAYITHRAQKLGATNDTAHVAGLMAVYELGNASGYDSGYDDGRTEGYYDGLNEGSSE